MDKSVTDVIFADDAEVKGSFAAGFAWGCATTAGLCLLIVALATTLGN